MKYFASSLYMNLFENISGIMIWEKHSGFVHNNCKGYKIMYWGYVVKFKMTLMIFDWIQLGMY